MIYDKVAETKEKNKRGQIEKKGTIAMKAKNWNKNGQQENRIQVCVNNL